MADIDRAGRSDPREDDPARRARGDLFLAQSKRAAMLSSWPEPRTVDQAAALASVVADIARLEAIVASLPERPPGMPPGVELPRDWMTRRSACRSCSAPVIWGTYPSGKRAPFDPDGTNHFATCPFAASHRR